MAYVYLFAYVCVFVHVYTLSVCKFILTHNQTYYVCAGIGEFVCVRVCVCMCVHAWVNMCVCVCMLGLMYVCVCKCVCKHVLLCVCL